MTACPNSFDRQAVLRAIGTTTVGASVTGCLSEEMLGCTVLSPLTKFECQQELDLWYPAYGGEILEVTVPAPGHDREVTSSEYVGDRHTMFTFPYTNCEVICTSFATSLQCIQADFLQERYDEEFTFLPTTFDPQQDTREVIGEYSESIGADVDAGNWYFLRPETPTAANRVVRKTFGVAFGGDDAHDSHELTQDEQNVTNGSDHVAHAEDTRHFQHTSSISLGNKDGIAERIDDGGPSSGVGEIGDTCTVIEEW